MDVHHAQLDGTFALTEKFSVVTICPSSTPQLGLALLYTPIIL